VRWVSMRAAPRGTAGATSLQCELEKGLRLFSKHCSL
jgi:hypothetical protein